jgi:hypothetical protein
VTYWQFSPDTTRQPAPEPGSPSAARTLRKGTPPHVVSQDVKVAHSHVNTGNKLLVFEGQCNVRDRRRSQPPQAASYLGLPEEAMSGLGHDELLARPRIGSAYPAEASAGVQAGQVG